MKILKNAGSFEVLSKPENVIKNIATAARTCYQTKGTPESDVVLVKRLVDRGHTAMLEFGDMTVQFNNLSRGFTHELVRHRLCSYAQESTRFVDESGPQCCCPS
ncbi:MAG: FAD-dependent thymidylate synthase [Nanoarchaeota archaeon]|nr:FAD-dependent thymidylate synthase [Nanoarchaeota archaeon]